MTDTYTASEAMDAWRKYHNTVTNQAGERFEMHIPVQPMDPDCVLTGYINQSRAKIEALQQEVSRLRAGIRDAAVLAREILEDELTANPGALSQDKGESVQAMPIDTAPRGSRVLIWGYFDPYGMQWQEGAWSDDYDGFINPALDPIERPQLWLPLPPDPSPVTLSPLEGIEPQPIAEISNLAKSGSQSTDNGEGEA